MVYFSSVSLLLSALLTTSPLQDYSLLFNKYHSRKLFWESLPMSGDSQKAFTYIVEVLMTLIDLRKYTLQWIERWFPVALCTISVKRSTTTRGSRSANICETIRAAVITIWWRDKLSTALTCMVRATTLLRTMSMNRSFWRMYSVWHARWAPYT